MSDQDLDELLGGWDTEYAEIRPAWSRNGDTPLHGMCRTTSHDGAPRTADRHPAAQTPRGSYSPAVTALRAVCPKG
ncbi:hypothetical protein NKH18_27815 [Streptomyces sp. M10(2022)]